MRYILFSFIFLTTLLYGSISIETGEQFTLSEDENLSIDGGVTINHGARLKANSNSNIILTDDWLDDGVFYAEYGSVNFIGNNAVHIIGSTTFYSFISKGQKEIIFESGKVQRIEGDFVLHGDDNLSRTTIVADVPGMQAILDLSVVASINTEYLKITDNKIIGRASALNPPNSDTTIYNTILWFSQIEDMDCVNIGSGTTWYEKLQCDSDKIQYLVFPKGTGDIPPSVITFNKDMLNGDAIKVIVHDANGSEGKHIELLYQSPENNGDPCARNVQIVLAETGKMQTGYTTTNPENCQYDDPTLENWDLFIDPTDVTLLKVTEVGNRPSEVKYSDENPSVIVIDVNLTQYLNIGGN